jgi:flagellar protein FliS
MHTTTARAARAYAQVGTQSGVESADPHRLVLMLFDGAIECIARARSHFAAGRIGPRGEALSQAIQIIELGLKASLDREAGGDLAASLAELYDYVARRLLAAGMASDPAPLAEATRLLTELRDAWSRIQPGAR